jgi:hypothetical protein
MPWHSIVSKMRIMLQIDLFSLFPCFFYEMDYSHILLTDLVLESSNHMAIRERSNSVIFRATKSATIDFI